MEELALLTSLAVFTLLAAACSIIFNKIRLPPLIGYIVAGIIIANVWTITNDSEQIVSILSDIGLVMLMFCIGLEINLRKIRKQGLFAMGVVIIQLPLMMLGGIVAGMLLGYDMVQCICLGAIISGSSTAVVMAVLKSQKELDADHKESLVLVLIMEDIGQVIILSMITPIMASNDPSVDVNSLIVMIVSIIVFMVASIVVGLKLIPRAINWVSDNVSDEILTVFSVGLAFGMALLSIYIGLSMAIGAFLMGMMIAGSRKSKEINHKIEPMRDLFMAIFFISIGMEITVSSLIDNIGTIIVLYLIFLILIVVAVFIAYWFENETCRNGFLSAVSLATMGEFAFIIASEALGFGAIDQSFYTSVVGAALLSMVILPFLSRYSPRIWDKSVEKCPRPIYATCCRLNETRERVYSRVYATSKKSRKAMYRSMTHSYINILAIAAIEIAFYFLIPVCVDWITANFGGTRDLWSIVMLMVNFAVLMMPVYHLVNNVKFLDEMIIGGARRIAKREGNLSEPGAIYQRFLEINTYIMVLIIVALIVIICPNSVGLWQHLVVLGLAAIVLAVFYLKRLRDDRKKPPSAQRTQTPDQDDEGDDL
ncbi:cation:proton antiporter [Methanomassiliicoccaceae archaeon DOK]|nr:cation:proton antiporter [Methanomassiliicoccaceae archaeon DOK]